MNPIIAFLLAGVTAAAAPDDAPLRAPSAAADRGEVKAGPVLTQRFALTHHGREPLTVTGVEGGCGCVRAAVSRTELRPGDATELAVDVNTLTQPEGRNAWRVTVRYRTGTATLAADFRVTATLVREVTVTPPAVVVSTTGAASHTLTVADRRDQPLTVTKAVSTSPHVVPTVRGAATRDGRRVQEIDLAIAADVPVGHHDETVALLTDDPAYRELRVPVRVSKRAAGAVAVTPDAAALRFAAGQAEASAVAVVRATGAPVRIERAECDDPRVRVKWSPGAGPVATVRVTVAAGPAGRSEVRVLLAEPAGHTVRLPVSWAND